MSGEGFAFFRWHVTLYGCTDNYCATNPQSHRDYCLNKWENFRHG